MIAVAAVVGTGVGACDDDPATREVTASAPASTVASGPPHPIRDNVGTGRLRRTRFAVDPVVSILRCGPDEPKACTRAAYAIFARLNRDIPRRASGMIAADFYVDELGGRRYADPVGRQSRPRFCFQQTVATDAPAALGLPTDIGARVRVTLRSFDRRGEYTGELATTVRLTRPESKRAVNDISPPAQQVAVGC